MHHRRGVVQRKEESVAHGISFLELLDISSLKQHKTEFKHSPRHQKLQATSNLYKTLSTNHKLVLTLVCGFPAQQGLAIEHDLCCARTQKI